MQILLKGGRVVDPAAGQDGVADVLIEDEVVAQVGTDLPADGARVIYVPADCVVCPGFIDMHVHLREPGQEHKETIATGATAAVAGGFTGVACMPNTDPVNDQAGITESILAKARAAGQARVYPIGAVSRGSKGEQLADLAELKAAGCVAVSDDGYPVADALLMRRALEYAASFGLLVIDHCEDPSLVGGVAHEGYHATALGLRGLPAVAEELIVERDVTLSGLTGAPVHVAHMSARGSLRAVRSGKARAIKVTCEVTPHHFILTDEALQGYDTNVKMNPPLREAADRDAMLEGLADGSIDVIATDHAPHHYDEKAVEFDQAPFGITGLETAVSLSLDRLVHREVISLNRLVELYSTNPARILGVAGGTLAPGGAADVTILAPEAPTTVDVARMRSKGKNTPFGGWELRGCVAATIVGGQMLYVSDAVPEAAVFTAGGG
ncbi:MAG: dihydroorotase [Vicinamibacterales bacterium]|jgi:dihydroorotase|nr:dihydroorotase [Acidobacteriota bacterium]MDP7295588.1 dihydroorotase [Vicinamibacterales bacterium]MDP7471404.1 dihydroorotase [Vicinamibacterales bacterium]MDP7671162.1 dihydroorotase [Vicinamibacterales bacterium]HJO39952.1 dihydroorotase [Vicinamibacterales bacterium]